MLHVLFFLNKIKLTNNNIKLYNISNYYVIYSITQHTLVRLSHRKNKGKNLWTRGMTASVGETKWFAIAPARRQLNRAWRPAAPLCRPQYARWCCSARDGGRFSVREFERMFYIEDLLRCGMDGLEICEAFYHSIRYFI